MLQAQTPSGQELPLPSHHTFLPPLSPTFHIDYEHLKIPSCPSSQSVSFRAIYLHTPIRLTPLPTPELCNRAVALSALRHPNLEFLLGTTFLPPSSLTCVHSHTPAAVTDAAAAVSLSSLPAPLALQSALHCALDIARACVYLHQKTDAQHGDIREETVYVDVSRRRAVLGMLFVPQAAPAEDQGADVRALLRMLARCLGAGDLEQGMRCIPRDETDGGRAGLYAAVNVALHGYVYDARLPRMEETADMLENAVEKADRLDSDFDKGLC
jgi:hypothetical protein